LDNRIVLKECGSLSAAGFKVMLIVADGLGNGEHHGISILDVGKSRGRITRMCLTSFSILRKALDVKADAYHLHDPELLPIGLWLKWRGFKVIYDSHEDVPRQILSKHWIPTPIRRIVSIIFELFENFVIKRITGVIAATPHIALRFKRINANTIDVNNYPKIEELAPLSGCDRGKRQICYIGGISHVRGIHSVVRALPHVPEVNLVLCGTFSEAKFVEELRVLGGWRQVDFRGHVGREEVRAVMNESFAGMVTLLPTPAYIHSLPIKMFEYMSAELPVIASDFPLWREIIDGAGAGLCVDPASPEAIGAAIRKLADDPGLARQLGKRGREAILTKYNWPVEAQKLITFYKDIL
jgi:glycosyltransferase involved in cell wall biosynthesis